MTDQPTHDLDGLRAAVEKATPGPLECQDLNGDWMSPSYAVVGPDTCIDDTPHEQSAPDKETAFAFAALLNAARSGLLDDAALGRAVRAAAERDGPEREVMADAIRQWRGADYSAATDAARALIAMQEVG